tara:strand:+ start:881 stop:2020 length:1140 start_codon:yes stop_codon:yes gene_type:complete
VGGFGTREGEYFPSFARAFRGSAFGSTFGDLSDQAKVGEMIDSSTGAYIRFYAPAAAKIISPVTALLLDGPEQAKLKRQLGITGSLFGLQSIDPDLLTFDPFAEALSNDPARSADAARLFAANARAMSILALELTEDLQIFAFDSSSVLSAALANAPDRFLFNDNAEMAAVVSRVPEYATLRPEVQSAIAHLINAYAAAAPIQINKANPASGYLMGIRGYLLPQIIALRQENSIAAASNALAVTTPQILLQIERYGENIAVTTTGFFLPAPDHYETTANTPLRLVSGRIVGRLTGHPLENDFHANGPKGSIGFFGSNDTQITAVSVPTMNNGQVSASLGADNEVIITPVPGFTGVTYVDYTVSHPEGETGNARIFVRVV